MQLNTTISDGAGSQTGVDYHSLRQEGIDHLQRLVGHLWTDYNAHDPGVTILEQLCYALTDLSYRLAFDLPDLLAEGGSNPYADLFSPAEILSSEPVTLTDYRKLIIDTELMIDDDPERTVRIKNAWLIREETPRPTLHLVDYSAGPDGYVLGVKADPTEEISQEMKLRGVYEVLLEPLVALSDTEKEALQHLVLSRLLAHRSAGMDFAAVKVMDQVRIGVRAEIEIGEVETVSNLRTEILQRINRYISPPLTRYSLEQFLDKGKRIDEIMEGPRLENGFLDSEELEQKKKKSQLRTSDLVQEIMDIPGVLAIRTLVLRLLKEEKDEICSPAHSCEVAGTTYCFEEAAWLLPITRDQSPLFAAECSELTFYREGNPIEWGDQKVEALIPSTSGSSFSEGQRDPVFPPGRDRQTGRYFSIQDQFPANYGLAPESLPTNASPERVAQAHKLRGYLMFFDQVLAQYFAQLAHAKELFSFHSESDRTYFYQILQDSVPGAEEILRYPWEVHEERLDKITEGESTRRDRRNRFLNHLMARFCEQFTDYSLLLYSLQPANVAADNLIQHKKAFLQDYPKLSAGRGRGIDYSADHSIPSGLKQRICRKIGVANCPIRKIIPDELLTDFRCWLEKDFPFNFDDAHFEALVQYGWEVENYTIQASQNPESFHIQIIGKEKQVLAISQSVFDESVAEDKIGNEVKSRTEDWKRALHEEGFHVIEHHLFRPITADLFNGSDDPADEAYILRIPEDAPGDPYSLQISYVFPDWGERFSQEAFRRFVERTVREESPAHLRVRIHWWGREKITAFESAYMEWLEEMALMYTNNHG